MIVDRSFTSLFISHLSHDNKTPTYYENLLHYLSLGSIIESQQ